MSRKTSYVLLGFFLTFLILAQPVQAAQDMFDDLYASAYETDNVLYAFTDFPYQDNAEAALATQNQFREQKATPEKVVKAALPIKIMLLVDCSTSMPEYKSWIQRIADALFSEHWKLELSVSTFGKQFTMITSHLTDAKSAKKALSDLRYQEDGTDICGGALQAVDYVKESLWTPGELCHVIIVTDGEPFYSKDAAIEAESERDSARILKDVLEQSPQILLHSLCFDKWSGEADIFDAISAFGGIHAIVSNATETEEAVHSILDFINRLYQMRFLLETPLYYDNLQLVTGTNFVQITHWQNFDVIPMVVIDAPERHLPQVIDQEPGGESEESERPEVIHSPDDADAEPDEKPYVVSPENPSASATDLPKGELPAESTDAMDESEKESKEQEESTVVSDEAKNAFSWRWIAVGIIFALVTVGAVVAYTLFVKPKQVSAQGKLIRIEVAGSKENTHQFQLHDHLLIGRDKRCDLSLLDDSVSSVNTRIFLKDEQVYIEDLNSPCGTAIDGMKIFTPNLLHDGDEALVGNVSLKFYFA